MRIVLLPLCVLVSVIIGVKVALVLGVVALVRVMMRRFVGDKADKVAPVKAVKTFLFFLQNHPLGRKKRGAVAPDAVNAQQERVS
jgi:hypothetical protein